MSHHGHPKWAGVAALLAGGASRRMGQTKAGLSLGMGKTASARALQVLKGLADEVVVLGHGQGIEDLRHLNRLDDADVGKGPLAGILALLESNHFSEALVIPVDMPGLKKELVEELLLPTQAELVHFGSDPSDVTQPFPMRLKKELAPRLRQQLEAGRFSVRDFLTQCNRQVLPFPPGADRAFFNLNTPEDVSRFNALEKNEGQDVA